MSVLVVRSSDLESSTVEKSILVDWLRVLLWDLTILLAEVRLVLVTTLVC